MQLTLANSLCPCCGKPRRIAHLIDLYERNYQLLERLVPELNLPFDHAVSKCSGDLPLHLIAVERSPYTVEFRLTYEFRDEAQLRLEPDFWVKVYRDARVAEAHHVTGRPLWLAQEGGAPEAHSYLNDQWNRNHMFAKWLEYLLDQGHGFTHVARPRLATSAA